MRHDALNDYIRMLGLAIEQVIGIDRRTICDRSYVGNQRDCRCVSLRSGACHAHRCDGE